MRNGGGVKMGWAGVDPWGLDRERERETLSRASTDRPTDRLEREGEGGCKIMRIKCSVFIMEIK